MKSFTRTLPIPFRGELHDVELVQFSLDPDEARAHVPESIAPLVIAGRALVSLVNVRLEGMRPHLVPRFLTFGFRHIAFRMLVDDAAHNADGAPHGIYFVRSFTEHPFVALGADWLSHYRLTRAEVSRPSGPSGGWEIRQAEGAIRYKLAAAGGGRPVGDQFADWDHAHAVVASLDRAYAVDGKDRLWRTRIHRPSWPIEPMGLASFHVDFFESARVECAFRVPVPVPYEWSAPELLEACAS